MKAVVLPVVFLMLLALASAAFGQHKGRGGQGRPAPTMTHDERRQLREDVGAARYGQRDMRRQDRMAPEEREKLRRDVQDANRDIKRK
jgi:hypothetical protein